MLVDTHAHVSCEYYDNIDEVISSAEIYKVERIIISGCDEKGIKEGLTLINKYPNLYMTIGFHPEETKRFKEEQLNWLEELIKGNKKIVGIGEIGLDYHYNKENKVEQKELFINQLDLATKLNYPVVIHSRDAEQDTIEILKKYKLKGIIHCFSGSYEVAKEYIKLGYFLGIGGVLTFKNSKLSTVIEKISLSNIVLETDSPYLSPEPHRGEKNEPKNVKFVSEKISEILSITPDEVAKTTTENAVSLFDLAQ